MCEVVFCVEAKLQPLQLHRPKGFAENRIVYCPSAYCLAHALGTAVPVCRLCAVDAALVGGGKKSAPV